jgi:uncharacterized protein YodC (DUF2158 family)
MMKKNNDGENLCKWYNQYKKNKVKKIQKPTLILFFFHCCT